MARRPTACGPRVNMGGDTGFDAPTGEVSLEELARPFLNMLQQATGLDSVYLTRIDWAEGRQHVMYSLNQGDVDVAEGTDLEWSDTLCRRALLTGPTQTVDVPGVFGDSAAGRDLKLQSYVMCPVVEPDQRIWGTLCGASSTVLEVDDKSMALMHQVATLIAERVTRERDIAMAARVLQRQQSRLEESNSRLSETTEVDLVTGLANRVGFDARWTQELSRASRYEYPVALVLIDLDGFRGVNETQGKSAGDEVLRRFAQAFKAETRDLDVVGRLGSDEFVIGLSHADTLEAEHICNRVSAATAALDVGSVIGPTGFSAGIASSASTPVTDLIDAADRALQLARSRKGGAVVTWTGEIPG